MKNQLKPMDVGGSGSFKITAEWGGKEGITVSAGGTAEVHDDNGNYIEANASQDSNGQGSADISVGHEEGDDK